MKKTAVITGASRGIGQACARALAEQGYHLALLCHTNKDTLEALRRDLIGLYGIEVFTYVGDISDRDFVAIFCKNVLKDLGHVDVLINNAGVAHIGLITDLSYANWDQIIGVNLNSLFYTTKGFVPSMISRKIGHIINISSMWGSVGASCEVAYSASKGGMNSFTKALAKELAPSGINVNAIACGVIDTDMNSMLSAEDKQQLEDDIPVGRMATPKEVADTVLSIVSAPVYLTGQIIGLDGGYI